MGLHKGGSVQDKTSTLEDLEARIQETVNDSCCQRYPLRHPAEIAHFISVRLRKLVDATGAYIAL